MWKGRFSFSLRQVIAIITSAGAAFALSFTLHSPPQGSSGLPSAILPALVLAIALWFCRNDPAARLGTYAVVAALLSLQFFASYFSRTDWLFGHTLGPPQLIVATCWASTVGVVAGGCWIVYKLSQLSARGKLAAADSGGSGQQSNSTGWLGAIVVVPLTLLSGMLALIGFAAAPRAMEQMDNYIQQRQIRAEWAAAAARARKVPREPPEVFEKKRALYSGLRSTDQAARYQTALEILAYKTITDTETRLNAVEIICICPHRHDGEVEKLISDGTITKAEACVAMGRALHSAPDDKCRKEIASSLGRMGPAAAVAVANLARELEEPRSANVRSEVANALAAIGPSGKTYAVIYFRNAWQKHLLTVEQAQALYRIDPETAEKLHIPRP